MFEAAWADFTLNLWLYLSMPITSGVVGFVTNVIALKMMFHPIEFVGVKPPYLGWQGIVPRKAGKMASIACDTIVPRLVSERPLSWAATLLLNRVKVAGMMFGSGPTWMIFSTPSARV